MANVVETQITYSSERITYSLRFPRRRFAYLVDNPLSPSYRTQKLLI